MSEKQATIQQLAQLAMEGDNVNPIEWGELAVNEEQAFFGIKV